MGVNREGAQFAVPVQAKVKSDRHAVVQSLQDIAYCREKLPNLVCRAVSAQFVEETETIVMFELTDDDGEIQVRNERHYQLVLGRDISDSDLELYRSSV